MPGDPVCPMPAPICEDACAQPIRIPRRGRVRFGRGVEIRPERLAQVACGGEPDACDRRLRVAPTLLDSPGRPARTTARDRIVSSVIRISNAIREAAAGAGEPFAAAVVENDGERLAVSGRFARTPKPACAEATDREAVPQAGRRSVPSTRPRAVSLRSPLLTRHRPAQTRTARIARGIPPASTARPRSAGGAEIRMLFSGQRRKIAPRARNCAASDGVGDRCERGGQGSRARFRIRRRRRRMTDGRGLLSRALTDPAAPVGRQGRAPGR